MGRGDLPVLLESDGAARKAGRQRHGLVLVCDLYQKGRIYGWVTSGGGKDDSRSVSPRITHRFAHVSVRDFTTWMIPLFRSSDGSHFLFLASGAFVIWGAAADIGNKNTILLAGGGPARDRYSKK